MPRTRSSTPKKRKPANHEKRDLRYYLLTETEPLPLGSHFTFIWTGTPISQPRMIQTALWRPEAVRYLTWKRAFRDWLRERLPRSWPCIVDQEFRLDVQFWLTDANYYRLDVKNLLAALEDACNLVVFHDDAYNVQSSIRKAHASSDRPAGLLCTVEVLSDRQTKKLPGPPKEYVVPIHLLPARHEPAIIAA